MTRLGAVLLLASVACEAAPRVFDRTCSAASRRSNRGGVACGVSFVQPSLSVAYSPTFGAECAGTAVSGLTVARASVAECISQDGQTITQVAANLPRVMTGAVDDSTLGVAVEQTTRTNTIDDSRDLSVASWTKTNMTCARTANGMRGGDTNGASTCTATGANGLVRATTGEAAGAYTCFSVYVKRRTGTGAVQPTIDGSVFLADISVQLSTTVWKRLVPGETLGCMAVSGGSSNCIVVAGLMDAPLAPSYGLRLATSGDAVDVDFAQAERCPDFRSSTPMATSGGNATRAAETPDGTLSVSLPSQYCAAATFVTTAASNTGAPGYAPSTLRRLHGVPGDGTPGDITASTSFDDSYDDNVTTGEYFINTTTLAAPSTFDTNMALDGGVRVRVASFWNGNNLNGCIDGFCANGADNPAEGAPDSDPYTPPTWTRYRFGGLDLGASSGKLDGVLKQVQLGAYAAQCQRFIGVAPSNFGASIGDSISRGTPPTVAGWVNAANQTWAATSRLQTEVLSKGGAYTGAGISNNNILYQWTNLVRGKNYGVLFVLGGVNDIKSGLNMTTALANLTQIWDEARADRLQLVVMTLTPCSANAGWNGTKQTQLETLNTAIRNYAAAHPGVILVDLYNSALRDGTALAAAYDSGDGLHPNAAGSALIASLVTAGRP